MRWNSLLRCTTLALLALPLGAQTLGEQLAGAKASEVAALTARLRAARAEGVTACLEHALGGASQGTPASQHIARDVLARALPRVRAELEDLLQAEVPQERLAAALALIGAIGEFEDLALALRIAGRFPLEPDAPPELGPAGLVSLRSAATELFARHAERATRTRALIERQPEPWASTLIAALGDSRTPQALAALGEWLARDRERQHELVLAISAAARGQRAPFDARTRAAVRACIEEPDTRGFRESVLCAGWLEDEDSADELAQLLRLPHAGVRADALWSLQRITGARLRDDPVAWRTWLSEQHDWREAELPELLERLGGPDLVDSAAALNELARRTYPRHSIAEGVADRVVDLDGSQLIAACQLLRGLDSTAALDGLARVPLSAREHEEARAVRETRRAIQRRPMSQR